MERQTRRYLLALALTVYVWMDPWDRDGLNRSTIYRMKKSELVEFISSVYNYWHGNMWPGDFRKMWSRIEKGALDRLWRA